MEKEFKLLEAIVDAAVKKGGILNREQVVQAHLALQKIGHLIDTASQPKTKELLNKQKPTTK